MERIYILSNIGMRGLLKIGQTGATAEERAAQLSKATGVPHNFKVEFTIQCHDSKLAERVIFRQLAAYRIDKKEFFRIDLQTAKEIVTDVVTRFFISDPNQTLIDLQRARIAKRHQIELNNLKKLELKQAFDNLDDCLSSFESGNDIGEVHKAVGYVSKLKEIVEVG